MDWQTVIALLVVGWAAWFLVRRLLRTATGAPSCGCHTCDDCPATSAESSLVTLGDERTSRSNST